MSKAVTVNHGSRSQKINVAGKTIDQVRGKIGPNLGWDVDGLDYSLNGTRSADLPGDYPGGTTLQAGDTLTFLPRAGNKG